MLPSVQSWRRDGTTHSPPNYPEEPSDTGTREDGSDGRGRHRREWVDDRPMGSLLRRDNDGSSYAREENREVLPVPGSRQRGARG